MVRTIRARGIQNVNHDKILVFCHGKGTYETEPKMKKSRNYKLSQEWQSKYPQDNDMLDLLVEGYPNIDTIIPNVNMNSYILLDADVLSDPNLVYKITDNNQVVELLRSSYKYLDIERMHIPKLIFQACTGQHKDGLDGVSFHKIKNIIKNLYQYTTTETLVYITNYFSGGVAPDYSSEKLNDFLIKYEMEWISHGDIHNFNQKEIIEFNSIYQDSVFDIDHIGDSGHLQLIPYQYIYTPPKETITRKMTDRDIQAYKDIGIPINQILSRYGQGSRVGGHKGIVFKLRFVKFT